MQRNSLTPIREESSLTDSKKSIKSNVFSPGPMYCPCAKFFQSKPKGKDPCGDKSYSSILDRPFMFRRAESLDKAVELQELKNVYTSLQIEEEEPTDSASFESLTSTVTKTTSTPCTPSAHTIKEDLYQDEYLMELGKMEPVEERSATSAEFTERKVLPDVSEESEAMRLAQKYLRIHRTFEFFQFLISHLLGQLPGNKYIEDSIIITNNHVVENPIRFLLDLLDKCIIYRAGLGSPPLLYEKKHIGALFNLMDPMRTGYIDLKQYTVGMKTLGICSFKHNPPVTKENTVWKEIFVDEAHENLIYALDDILKRRWISHKAGNSFAPLNTPPPTLTNLPAKTSVKI